MANTVAYSQDLGGGVRLVSITTPDAGVRIYGVQLVKANKTYNELFNVDTKLIINDSLGLSNTQLHVIFNSIEVVTKTK